MDKPVKLFSIKCDQPDEARRAKFDWMKDAMLPKAVRLARDTSMPTIFKWTGEMLYVARWNLLGDKFWSEAALGQVKPTDFTEASWVELPFEKLPIPYDAPFRYRD